MPGIFVLYIQNSHTDKITNALQLSATKLSTSEMSSLDPLHPRSVELSVQVVVRISLCFQSLRSVWWFVMGYNLYHYE